MSYVTTSNRPSPAGMIGAIGMPAAFGLLLVTGLAVHQVITPPKPNPTMTPFEIEPIEPEVIPEPVDNSSATSTETPRQTVEPTITRPDSDFDFEMGETEPITGFPPLDGDITGGLGPIEFDGPPITPTFDPVTVSPQGNPGRWITDNDYRTAWINRGYSGTAGFALEIDTRGRVNNCQITQSTGYAALDEATCRLLERRARFNPAKDSSGNSVAGTYSSSVNWRIPE